MCSSVLQAVPSVHMECEEEKENRDALHPLPNNTHTFNTHTPCARLYLTPTHEEEDEEEDDEEEDEEDDDSFFTSLSLFPNNISYNKNANVTFLTQV